MKRSKYLTITLTIALTCLVVAYSVNTAQSVPPIDTLVCYVAAEDVNPYVGDNVTISGFFKHYLNTTESLKNVTIELNNIDAAFNITHVNVNNYNITNYNLTQYLLDEDSTTPIYWWNSTYINITWAKFDHLMTFTYNFTVHCHTSGQQSTGQPLVSYFLNNESLTYNGAHVVLYVELIPLTPSIPYPERGLWSWQWWFIGSLLLAAPLIIIVVTRLTLWKR
ncbi:MAG: hypothetical protein KGD59_04870 [Candidatus Heimdallarchaeota archaeon]|nr:hypothetical protein [Candidatus Heimdallarchaeota archaeon]MBY8993861.1 hypothetical protein [Candidatus Heimdallarchaeota archaeon]